MIKLMIKWVIFALVIVATCYLPGIQVENFAFAMLVAAIITVVNIFIKPIVKLLTFPINMMTFGLFNLVLNFGMLYGISYFIPQYSLNDFVSAFIASVAISVSYFILKRI